MDLCAPASPPKYMKILDKPDVGKCEDRISSLPDAILCHMLSFLSTKYALRTGVLSTWWKDLWVSVPTLDFEIRLYANYKGDKSYFDSFAERHMCSFTNFVNRLLVLRDNLSVQKFRLSCYERFDFSHLYAWICYVIMSNARELDLALTTHELGELPPSLYTCKTLTNLKLSGEFILNLPFYVSLPCLKTLSLERIIYLDDTSVQRLLLSCPMLEDLTVKRPVWDNLLDFIVSVPSLKRLTLHFSIHREGLYDEKGYNYKLGVNAPVLEYLELFDSMSLEFSLNNMPCLVKGHINVYRFLESGYWKKEQKYGFRVFKILCRISNVKHLSLSGYTLRSLSYALRGKFSTFHHLIYLKLGFDNRNGPVLLPSLLQSAPNLQVLIFPDGIIHPMEQESDVMKDIVFDYKWRAPDCVPE